jgi:hypothetical protein
MAASCYIEDPLVGWIHIAIEIEIEIVIGPDFDFDSLSHPSDGAITAASAGQGAGYGPRSLAETRKSQKLP